MQKSVPTDRFHALDSLRCFAMFLGIALHVGVSFMVQPTFWPIRDKAPIMAADVFILAVHDFRMQLFFLLAGFFGCLLYQRYGIMGMVRHRCQRVAIPFVLSLLFIIPTVQAVSLYADIENVRAESTHGSPRTGHVIGLINDAPNASTIELVTNYFVTGVWMAHLRLAHLWFLYYLLYFFAAVALLAPILARLEGTRCLGVFDSAFRWIVESRARVLVPAMLTFPALLLMRNWSVETPFGWSPQWHILLYYFGFFGFGWILYRHRDLVATFGRGWKLNLTLANLLVLPLLAWLVIAGAPAERNGAAHAFGMKVGALGALALYTWLMITGLWGAFLTWFDRESAWTRYLADASYWCYLASLTPIMILQLVVADWEMAGLAKIVFIIVVTMMLLLASYEWCVRYTVIGAILNGRKRRGPPLAANCAKPAIEKQNCEISIANVPIIANTE